MSLKEFFHNRWVKFGFWALLYILWVIWLGNYWWLFGLAILFDLCVTKKSNGFSGKKNTRKEKNIMRLSIGSTPSSSPSLS